MSNPASGILGLCGYVALAGWCLIAGATVAGEVGLLPLASSKAAIDWIVGVWVFVGAFALGFVIGAIPQRLLGGDE